MISINKARQKGLEHLGKAINQFQNGALDHLDKEKLYDLEELFYKIEKEIK